MLHTERTLAPGPRMPALELSRCYAWTVVLHQSYCLARWADGVRTIAWALFSDPVDHDEAIVQRTRDKRLQRTTDGRHCTVPYV